MRKWSGLIINWILTRKIQFTACASFGLHLAYAVGTCLPFWILYNLHPSLGFQHCRCIFCFLVVFLLFSVFSAQWSSGPLNFVILLYKWDYLVHKKKCNWSTDDRSLTFPTVLFFYMIFKHICF